MSSRSRLIALSVGIALCLGGASPALAETSDWDPDDRPGKLDLRWGGLHVEDRDTVRLGISLWNRVYPRHLRSGEDRIMVSIGALDLSGMITPTRHGWALWFTYQGAYWAEKAKVDHPRPTLFRVWLDRELVTRDFNGDPASNEIGVSSAEIVRGRVYRDQLHPLTI